VKRKRLAFIIVLAVVILTSDFYLLQANMLAVGWHIRHGFHVDFEGLRFVVPLFLQQGQEGARDELTLYCQHSPIYPKNSWITIGFQPQSSATVLRPLAPDEARALGASLIREKAVRLADRQGNCIEYQRADMALRTGSSDRDLVWIKCRFGDITANFDGTRNATADFYRVLESARKVQN
jgi:hypothetical protein